MKSLNGHLLGDSDDLQNPAPSTQLSLGKSLQGASSAQTSLRSILPYCGYSIVCFWL